MPDLNRRAVLAALAALGGSPAIARTPVRVFAAASLKGALDAAVTGWPGAASLTFAGSSTLARQIEFGAPADIFISANVAWMDALEDDGLIVANSRIDLLGNRLVVIGAAGTAPLALADLPGALGDDRLAVALTEAVPAGIYARAALTRLDLWDPLRRRLAETDNVRAALALVVRGEAPYGIVYATDAKASQQVAIVAELPPASHPQIRYPAALIAGRDGSAPRALLAHLQGADAGRIFEAHGFTVPG